MASKALEIFVNGLTAVIAALLIAMALVGLVFVLIKMMLIDCINFLAEHAEDFE